MEFTSNDLSRFIKDHPHGSWEHGINQLITTGLPTASRPANNTIYNTPTQEKTRSTIRWQRVHDWLLLGGITTHGEIFTDYTIMRNFTTSSLARGDLQNLANTYRKPARFNEPLPSTETTQRLTSYAEFTELFMNTLSTRRKFEKAVRALPPGLIKSAIIMSEHQFAGLEPRRALIPNSPFIHSTSDISLEDLATGSSYVLTTYNRIIGIKERNFTAFKNTNTTPKTYEPIMQMATNLFRLDESEVNVFRAGYQCQRTKTNTWAANPPHGLLRTCIRPGKHHNTDAAIHSPSTARQW